MRAITAGDLNTQIPAGGQDEIGQMSRTLELFRDSLIERDKLAGERERAEEAEKRAQQQLLEAIEAVTDAFALYDVEDRLVVSNSHYRELYKLIDQPIENGIKYETVIKAAVDNRLIVEAQNDGAQWISERLHRHRNPTGPYEHQRADGRWLRINEQKTGKAASLGSSPISPTPRPARSSWGRWSTASPKRATSPCRRPKPRASFSPI